MTSRDKALDALREAESHSGDTQTGDHSAAMALIGIGYAVLELCDLLRPLTTDEAPETCRVCGCTTERPCEGGCQWIPDPKMLGELCSRCALVLGKAGLL